MDFNLDNMLSRIIFSFIFLLITNETFAQTPCSFRPIHLTSQSQVDSFPIVYGHCDRIDTFLFITGSNIVSLDSLYPLFYVKNMHIRFTHVKNLRGIHNLYSPGY